MNMPLISERNQKIVDEFRANGGKVGGHFEGRTLLLLHTVGAKSKEERINPVAYVKDGDCFVVIASKGGSPTNPSWFYNIKAHPHLKVEVGTQTIPVFATITTEPERSRLYDKMVEMMPGFAEYRTKTTRVIPVITLRPER
jgi:deazaflavin-dependent oxidoreductase (nitroreductase family)